MFAHGIRHQAPEVIERSRLPQSGLQMATEQPNANPWCPVHTSLAATQLLLVGGR